MRKVLGSNPGLCRVISFVARYIKIWQKSGDLEVSCATSSFIYLDNTLIDLYRLASILCKCSYDRILEHNWNHPFTFGENCFRKFYAQLKSEWIGYPFLPIWQLRRILSCRIKIFTKKNDKLFTFFEICATWITIFAYKWRTNFDNFGKFWISRVCTISTLSILRETL